MKMRMLMVAVAAAQLFFIAESLYAGNGDLIVNGNLGVGTTTPADKAEINGNIIVNGNATVKGNATTNGNTIVNGNLGIGTTTPQAKLDVNGTISVVIDGKRFTLQYANFSEDVYGARGGAWTSDTCDGDTYKAYTCPPDATRTCTDCLMYNGCQSITCKPMLYFIAQ